MKLLLTLTCIGIFFIGCSHKERQVSPDYDKVHRDAKEAFKEVN